MFRIALLDDDKILVNLISEHLEKCLASFNKVFEISKYTNPTLFLEDFIVDNYDIVFLDIVMPKIDGFKIAKRIKNINKNTILIFISSHNNLALEAYEYHPFYFIHKADINHIKNKLDIIIRQIIVNFYQAQLIVIKDTINGKCEKAVCDIIDVTSSAHYIEYHLLDGNTIFERNTIDNVYSNLESYGFCRVHRRTIVNLYHINSYYFSTNKLILKNGKSIFVTKTFQESFKDEYRKYNQI